jgi:uncharacterized membrane protein YgcG
MLLGAGILLIAGGGTSLYGLWYLRGRDPHAGLVAEFLPTPPDDLPPGVVGALLDERADERDIVASVVELGRRGVIRIRGIGEKGSANLPNDGENIFEMIDPAAPLLPFERPIVAAIFGPVPKAGDKVRLEEIRQPVRRAYPDVRSLLDEELVKRGLFPRSPESTRGGWRTTAKVIAIVTVLAGAAGIALESWWAVFPAVVALILADVVYRVGQSMPKKTPAGAEAAAKWRAFRRYLDDIERYERIDERQQTFNRYLPFAIAFGIESGWVNKFAAVSTSSPGWLPNAAGDVLSIPTPRHSSTWIGPSSSGADGGGIDLPDVNMPKIPSMQKLSNNASSGLQSTSSGFSSLLSVAGAIFEIIDAFSGGGGSGGSSGGGGGGFK